jgi:hypothetical protein
VGGQIIHHHDVTWLQSWDQASLQIDAENLAGHRFVDDEGGGDAINAVLAAVGYNFRLLLRWLKLLVFRMLIEIVGTSQFRFS